MTGRGERALCPGPKQCVLYPTPAPAPPHPFRSKLHLLLEESGVTTECDLATADYGGGDGGDDVGDYEDAFKCVPALRGGVRRDGRGWGWGGEARAACVVGAGRCCGHSAPAAYLAPSSSTTTHTRYSPPPLHPHSHPPPSQAAPRGGQGHHPVQCAARCGAGAGGAARRVHAAAHHVGAGAWVGGWGYASYMPLHASACLLQGGRCRNRRREVRRRPSPQPSLITSLAPHLSLPPLQPIGRRPCRSRSSRCTRTTTRAAAPSSCAPPAMRSSRSWHPSRAREWRARV